MFKITPYILRALTGIRTRIMVLCCRMLNETGYPQLLQALEDSLKKFDIDSWQPATYREFKERLTSSDYYISEGAVLEILAAYDICNIIGFDKLCLHPKLRNGKIGDVLVILQDKQLFFEFTSLTKENQHEKLKAYSIDLQNI